MTTHLYSMKALAEKLGTTYGYIRQLMLKVKRGEISSWQGYKFISIGDGKRSTWIAFSEKDDIVFHDVDDPQGPAND